MPVTATFTAISRALGDCGASKSRAHDKREQHSDSETGWRWHHEQT
jgi:hypothetical protein